MKAVYEYISKYEKHKIDDMRLPFTLNTSTYQPNQFFKTIDNWHENFELIVVADGQGKIFLNGNPYDVTAGNIVAINSNTLHTITSGAEGMTFHYFIIDHGFCLDNFCDTNKLWFKECFSDSQITQDIITLLELFAIEEKKDWQILAIRSTVIKIMSRLCEKHCHYSVKNHNELHIFSAIKQAISFIRANYSRDISLDEISNHVGLSKYYFAHEFHRITGYTFVEYVNLLRCEKAKKLLLKTSKNVDEIGTECGFPNRNYFTRTFKSYVGITPSEFRKQNPQ